MSEKEDKKLKLIKQVGIVVLGFGMGVSLIFGLIFIQLEFDPRDNPIFMTEPSYSKQCEDVMVEMTKFKNYLGFEDFIPPELEVSYSDLEYYNRLDKKIHELGCDS